MMTRDSSDQCYTNWPSKQAVRQNLQTSVSQRSAIKRLSESPNRVSPMKKFITGTATISVNPKVKNGPYVMARDKQARLKSRSLKTSPRYNRHLTPGATEKKQGLETIVQAEYSDVNIKGITKTNFMSKYANKIADRRATLTVKADEFYKNRGYKTI